MIHYPPHKFFEILKPPEANHMTLPFENINNARDMGGIVTKDGRKIKAGKLYRTAGLHRATEKDLADLQKMNLGCIIDFRDEFERKMRPEPVIPGVVGVHLNPLPERASGGGDSAARKAYFLKSPETFFVRIYHHLATSEDARAAYEGFFRAIFAQKGAPVLWHCTQGKDRTGVGALLLLTALGVEKETIIEDYLFSNGFFEEEYQRMAATVEPEHRQSYRYLFNVTRENILAYLFSI